MSRPIPAGPGTGKGRKPDSRATPYAAAASVAEIHILQRLLELQPAYQRDRLLQIVALLARDPELVALDRSLHLELAVLDRADDALAEFLIDALAQRHGLAHALPGGFLWILEVERAGIDLPPHHMHAQEFLDLAQLQLVIGKNGERAFGALDRGFAALEVEARRDLACQPGEGVVDLGQIELGDDVETRHGHTPRRNAVARYIAFAANASQRALLISSAGSPRIGSQKQRISAARGNFVHARLTMKSQDRCVASGSLKAFSQ